MLRSNEKQFREVLVFKALGLVMSLNSRPKVIKKKKKEASAVGSAPATCHTHRLITCTALRGMSRSTVLRRCFEWGRTLPGQTTPFRPRACQVLSKGVAKSYRQRPQTGAVRGKKILVD